MYGCKPKTNQTTHTFFFPKIAMHKTKIEIRGQYDMFGTNVTTH